MSAASFNPQNAWVFINQAYNQAAYIRITLNESPNNAGTALDELNVRMAKIGASLQTASGHHPDLQRSYKSLQFQVELLTHIVQSRASSALQLPASSPQLAAQSPAAAVPSALAQALPMGNYVEGSTNQFKDARARDIKGGHEACTPIAVTAAHALLGLPTGPDSLDRRYIGLILEDGMRRYQRLFRKKEEIQEQVAQSLEDNADNAGLRHDLLSRQFTFPEIKEDFVGLAEAGNMTIWNMKKPEHALASGQKIIRILHNYDQDSKRGAGAIIVHGGKTYAVVLLDKTIYFFDSHGFSNNEDNAYIAHFNETNETETATQFIARKIAYQAPAAALSVEEIKKQVSESLAIEESLNPKQTLSSDEFLKKLQDGEQRYQADQAKATNELNMLTINWVVPKRTLTVNDSQRVFIRTTDKASPTPSQQVAAVTASPQGPRKGDALHQGAKKMFNIFQEYEQKE